MSTKTKILIIVILILILAAILDAFFSKDEPEVQESYSEVEEELIITEKSTALSIANISSVEYDSFDDEINLTDMTCTNNKATTSNGTITIGKEGIYRIYGSSDDCNIIINADKQDIVLVLDNAKIKATNTSVINVYDAESVIINIPKDTTSELEDCKEYSVYTDNDEPDGAIFSKDDLYITGSGTLKVKANHLDGIVSKDIVAIVDTTLDIEAKDDGIKGKDYVSINNSTIRCNSKGDGIKSTNEEDSSLGYVIIKDSKLEIVANSDGIQAETVLNITNTEATFKTIEKSLKAVKEITINGGNYTTDSIDDSIHSDNYLIINGGTFNITTLDDGIHSNNNIMINDGDITINTDNEGIEARFIKINGGKISIQSQEDAINIFGGNELEAPSHISKEEPTEDSERQLVINGGEIYIVSEGDGLDSNGTIIMNGGKVIIVGTERDDNAAIDYDYTFVMNGGLLYFYGANNQWWKVPSSKSTQCCICFEAEGSRGDRIVIQNNNTKEEVISFTTEKAYGAIGLSSEKIIQGESYTLYINDNEIATITQSKMVTSNIKNDDRNDQRNMNNPPNL